MKTVGCRIITVRTGLFCEIEIGHRAGENGQSWTRLKNAMARLPIADSGLWGYIVNSANVYEGITILPLTPNQTNPDGSRTYPAIADLFGVSEKFLNNVTCGNSLSGRGIWTATKEEVNYELFFPCV